MSQPILVKAYGSFSPMAENTFSALRKICSMAMPLDPENSPLSFNDDLCLLSFEGIYFPVEDFIRQLKESMTPQMAGKLDYLDLEKWRMTRYLLEKGQISSKTVSLNHVLDYSGF